MDSGFQSTAIPAMGSEHPNCESDIRLTRPPVTRESRDSARGRITEVESSKPITISEVLERLEIPPSTVLAVHVRPAHVLIKDDAKLELVVVSQADEEAPLHYERQESSILANTKAYMNQNKEGPGQPDGQENQAEEDESRKADPSCDNPLWVRQLVSIRSDKLIGGSTVAWPCRWKARLVG